MNEVYADLFTDSFLAALIFPFQGELLIRALTAFPEYHMDTVFFIAVLASLSGHVVNMSLGRVLFSICKNEPWFYGKLEGRYAKISSFLNGYPMCIVLLSGFSVLGGFITLLAGFFKIRLIPAIIMIVLAKIFYYSLVL